MTGPTGRGLRRRGDRPANHVLNPVAGTDLGDQFGDVDDTRGTATDEDSGLHRYNSTERRGH
ncbi:hypothetical protein C8039_03135 [Halogeometricum sp. wsp3]|nr:hypothetical protein C8039_03135 [Halogeometricum sp. wsp3]